MEVMTAAYAANAPHTQPTRDSRPGAQAPAIGASQAQQYSAPASQESVLSVNSNSSSYPHTLQSDSSNVSQLTNLTEWTSPSTASARPLDLEKLQTAGLYARARTPEDRVNGDFPLASPMSITSPVTTNGTKRTASGHVKNAPSIPSTPLTATFSPRKSRTESISSTGSRAGDLAANLKMRLGYAMTKVQNGWEHKNIGELEQMTAQKTSPQRYSGSNMNHTRRPSINGLSFVPAPIPMYDGRIPVQSDAPASPPSKRHSGMYTNRNSTIHHPVAPLTTTTTTIMTTTPRLQPAADIRTSQDSHLIDFAMSPPRTPVSNFASRRPQTIRTDTQTAEAERDALQALTQLGSPHNSQFSRHHHSASQASSSQASPLRGDTAMPARRVTFARGDSESSAAESSSQESILNGRA